MAAWTWDAGWNGLRRARPGALGEGLAWFALGAAMAIPCWEAVGRYPTHAALALGALAGLGALGWAMLRNPAWGACVLIVLIYWNASDVVTDAFGFSWLLRLALGGAAAAWAAQRLAGGSEPLRWPMRLPLAAYGAALLLSAAVARDRPAAQASLAEFVKGAAVFYLVANLLGRPRFWRWGLTSVLGGATLLALPVAYQGLSGSRNVFWGFGSMVWDEIVPGQMGWRLGGAIGDPNFLALALAATLPLALVGSLDLAAPRWSRLLHLLAGGLVLLAILFTYSRASLLGLGLVAGAALWKYRRRRAVWAAALLALAGAMAASPAGWRQRIATLSQASLLGGQQQIGDMSFRIRRNVYLTGLLMFAEHPLLGVGPGNYESNYLTYSAQVGLSGEDVVRDPHSLPIQIAAETGLVGVVCFLALLWAGFGRMERARRRLVRLNALRYADLIWSLELALATYLLLSLFLHGAYFRHFLLLLALGTSGASLVPRPAEAA